MPSRVFLWILLMSMCTCIRRDDNFMTHNDDGFMTKSSICIGMFQQKLKSLAAVASRILRFTLLYMAPSRRPRWLIFYQLRIITVIWNYRSNKSLLPRVKTPTTVTGPNTSTHVPSTHIRQGLYLSRAIFSERICAGTYLNPFVLTTDSHKRQNVLWQ